MAVEEATAAEKDAIVELARRFARERIAPIALDVANSHQYPYELFDLLRTHGYCSLPFPTEWGGVGLDLWTLCRVIEELAAVSNTAASLLMGQFQGSLPLLIAGDDELRNRYLRDAALGRIRVAMALTEPDAGSDVAGIKSLARPDGDDFVLTGRKTFITMASVADLITVYVKLSPGRSTSTIQGFLVPCDTPGLIIGRTEEKMGATALPTSEVILDDCRIPSTHRLGEAGTGFHLAMQVLERVRVVVAARAVGLATGALEAVVTHLQEREAFERPLAAFQGLQFMVADMATSVEAARGLVARACRAVAEGDPAASRYCAMAKYFATDTAMAVTTDAVQLFGGYGYMKDYPVEHRMREAKVAQIVDGTNQIQRLIVARDLLGKAAREPRR